MANGNMGKPSWHQKIFSTHLGGCTPLPTPLTATVTGLRYTAGFLIMRPSYGPHYTSCPSVRLPVRLFYAGRNSKTKPQKS